MVRVPALPGIALEQSSPGTCLVDCPLTGTYNSADQHSLVLSRYRSFESKDGEPLRSPPATQQVGGGAGQGA